MATKFECNPRRPEKYGVEGFYEVEHLPDEEGKVREQFHLFRVKAAWREIAGNTHHCAEVFVLAATADDACAQAQCGLRLDSFGFEKRPVVQGSVVLVGERVPFLVRGWSGQEF